MKIVMVNLARHPNSIRHPIIKCVQLGPLDQKIAFPQICYSYRKHMPPNRQNVWS